MDILGTVLIFLAGSLTTLLVEVTCFQIQYSQPAAPKRKRSLDEQWAEIDNALHAPKCAALITAGNFREVRCSLPREHFGDHAGTLAAFVDAGFERTPF